MLLAEKAVSDEDDQLVVEAVERRHLLPHLAQARGERRMLARKGRDPPQIGRDRRASGEVLVEAAPILRDHVAAHTGLFALHLEQDIARQPPQRHHDVGVAVLRRAVEVVRREETCGEYRDHERDQDEQRELDPALCDDRRTR